MPSSSLRKFTQLVYFSITLLIILGGLSWFSLIIMEVFEKGRWPQASDARFLKGVKSKIAITSTAIIIYGSLAWLFFTGFLWLLKTKLGNQRVFRFGFIAFLFNVALFYFLFYSEIGQWVLD